jgi:hypothetical protein
MESQLPWWLPPNPTASRSTTSMYSSNLDRSWPPNASPNLLELSIHVHLWVHPDTICQSICKLAQLWPGSASLSYSISVCKLISKLAWSQPPSASLSYSISASQCISKLARSQPSNVSPNLLDHGLQVHPQPCSITATKCISKVARSLLPSPSLSSRDHNLPVLLRTRSITTSKCILKLPRTRPPSASQSSTWSRPHSAYLSSLDHHVPLHLQTRSIMASKCISKLAQWRPPSVSLCSLNWCLLVLLQLRSSTVCSHIDCICIYIETYIDNTCHIMMKQILWL